MHAAKEGGKAVANTSNFSRARLIEILEEAFHRAAVELPVTAAGVLTQLEAHARVDVPALETQWAEAVDEIEALEAQLYRLHDYLATSEALGGKPYVPIADVRRILAAAPTPAAQRALQAGELPAPSKSVARRLAAQVATTLTPEELAAALRWYHESALVGSQLAERLRAVQDRLGTSVRPSDELTGFYDEPER